MASKKAEIENDTFSMNKIIGNIFPKQNEYRSKK